jgi:hypothetical protein
MTLQQQIANELSQMSDDQLTEVGRYVEYLRFRTLQRAAPPLDESTLAALYGEAAEEDRALAEAGMDDYAAELAREDDR